MQLDKYQEQPHLLDAHLPGIVTALMVPVRRALRAWHMASQRDVAELAAATGMPMGSFSRQRFRDAHVARLLRVVYALAKTRGGKAIVKLMPHDVADLEPAALALICSDASDSNEWTTRYVLLLWLSILVLVPFNLETVDSNSGLTAESGPLLPQLISTCQGYLADAGPVRDAAALCLAKLLTRPDTESSALTDFLQWAASALAVCTLAGPTPSAHAAKPGIGDGSGSALAPDLSTVSSAAAAISQGDLGSLPAAARALLSAGVMQALTAIAKHGARAKLQSSSLADVFSRVSAIAAASTTSGVGMRSSPLLRRLAVKLACRTGLTYLPPRLVTWRYNRGQRSLLANLALAGAPGAAAAAGEQSSASSGGNGQPCAETGAAGVTPRDATPAAAANADAHIDDDTEPPPEIDDIVDGLLCGLRDGDTVVRWSAAKGIGRVTARLPLEYADDVVAAVVALLSTGENDSAWHGGCLALAELARRGLLLPARLPDVVPRILAALAFDERRGAHSVGQHVRDAACYVVWAFARAYSPAMLQPHIRAICAGVLVTACFDREVNCRRAASAAFQETVGRLGGDGSAAGGVPHGIEVLTVADYISLGNRTRAYTIVAPAVAAFDEYGCVLVACVLTLHWPQRGKEHRRTSSSRLTATARTKHTTNDALELPSIGRLDRSDALRDAVLRIRLRHWDPQVRSLAAASLSALAMMSPIWAIREALPHLLPLVTATGDVFARHGALLGIAEIVIAVAAAAPTTHLETSLLDEIRNTVVRAEKARAYTGRGGELVRGAACRLIEAQCLAGHMLPRKAALRLLTTVEDCLRHPNEAIQSAAVSALRALAATPELLDGRDIANTDRLSRGFASRLRSEDNPGVRRGLALALGALPRSLYVATPDVLDDVIDALVGAIRLERVLTRRDAETRRNAAIALGNLVATVGIGAREHLVIADGRDASSSSQFATTPHLAAADGVDGGPDSFDLMPGLTASQFAKIATALLCATHDYATDNRGDVGSWVRRAALASLERVLSEVAAGCWYRRRLAKLVDQLHEGDAAARCTDFECVALLSELRFLRDPSLALDLARVRRTEVSGKRRLTTGMVSVMPPALDAGVYVCPRASIARNGLRLGTLVVWGDDGASLRGSATRKVGILVKIIAAGRVGQVRELSRETDVDHSSMRKDVIVRVDALSEAPPQLLEECFYHGFSRAALPPVRIIQLANDPFELMPRSLPTDVVAALLRCVSDKLDSLRGFAGEALCRLLHLPTPLVQLPGIPHRNALEQAFSAVGANGRISTASAGRAGHAAQGDSDGKSATGDGTLTANGSADFDEASDSGGDDSSDGCDDACGVSGDVPSDAASTTVETTGHEPPRLRAAPTTQLPQQSLQWAQPHVTFPRIVSLLSEPCPQLLTAPILEGLVSSVGGLTESVSKHSMAALTSWATNARARGDTPALERLATGLVALLCPRPKQAWDRPYEEDRGDVASASKQGVQQHAALTDVGVNASSATRLDKPPAAARDMGGYGTSAASGASYDPTLSRWFANILGTSADTGGFANADAAAAWSASDVTVDSRLATPTLRTLEVLLDAGAFDALQPPEHYFAPACIAAVGRRVAAAPDDAVRAMAAAGVYLCLLGFGCSIRTRALGALLELLVHPFPRVRKTTAERLYVRLLTMDAAGVAGLCDRMVLDILTDCRWDASLDVAGTARDKIYPLLLGSPPPERSGVDVSHDAPTASRSRGSAAGGRAGSSTVVDEGYSSLVRDAGY